jgi:REP element-mobilizing transposase RayT
MSADKFQNKYRIPSARAQWWDYGNNAAYFVTICTAHKEHYFGEIQTEQMILSNIGTMTNDCWLEIPAHFPFVELDVFVIMPNHVHGIIVIDKNENDVTPRANTYHTHHTCYARHVETRLIASLQTQSSPQTQSPPQSQQSAQTKTKTGGFAGNKNPMLNDNLSHILKWYKGRVTFESRQIHADFTWQARFHDHIIRNDAEYRRISDYIVNNPANWKDDKFYDE